MYLFGAVAVVLAAGMVVLFAMLGELSARVGTAGPAGGTGTVQLLTDAAVGTRPGAGRWASPRRPTPIWPSWSCSAPRAPAAVRSPPSFGTTRSWPTRRGGASS